MGKLRVQNRITLYCPICKRHHHLGECDEQEQDGG